jgi:3-phosphoshikimate 1-carboxyvinyltransferase
LFIGNAGTAMRFLTAFLTLGKGRYSIDGIPRMRQRPIGPLVEALENLGGTIEYAGEEGFPPLIVRGGGLAGGKAKMAGDVSSQFFSAILMTAPYARGDVEIEVEGRLVSAPYVDMTIDIMSRFGVEVKNDCFKSFSIKAGRGYEAREYEVEPDASSATYFFAASAITGGRVRMLGLDRASKQGDVGFVDVLGRMGCRIDAGQGWLEVGGGPLGGIDVDMNRMPDAVPALAVVAACAEGKTSIRNVANLRHKETDRLSALAGELSKAGCQVKEFEDGLEIEPGVLRGAVFETYNDHRMAMSLALFGLRLEGVKIKNPECVAKTFPDYFQRLEALVASARQGKEE